VGRRLGEVGKEEQEGQRRRTEMRTTAFVGAVGARGGLPNRTRTCAARRGRNATTIRMGESDYKNGLEEDVGDYVPFARENEGSTENENRVKELLEMLDDPDPTVRLRAVVATRDMSNEEAAPVICKVFDSGEKELQNRYFATLALGYKPNPRSYDILVSQLDAENDPEIRANALAALGYLGDDKAVPTLIRALYEETHWTAKCAAAVSLGIIRDSRGYDALMSGLRMDPKGLDDIKIGCIGALGELGDVRCVDKLVEFASSRNFIVRQTLSEALGNLPTDKSRETLEMLAKDSHQNVSMGAQMALERMAKS